MKSVLELGSKYIVPAIRREVVLKLIKKGFMGVEIAKILKISPSLITRYINGERGTQVDLRRYKDIVERIENLVDKISSGEVDQYIIAKEIDRIAIYFMSRKHLCEIHKKLEPNIVPDKCSICLELFKTNKIQ
ncbi:MAG: transcriptional regulator [Ignisphaera sp.]|uniref:Transcriptional regulator n=1 Tax=Ignisphaera aggregans TaxID=334771 RepID=A0A7J3MZL3_9CREN